MNHPIIFHMSVSGCLKSRNPFNQSIASPGCRSSGPTPCSRPPGLTPSTGAPWRSLPTRFSRLRVVVIPGHCMALRRLMASGTWMIWVGTLGTKTNPFWTKTGWDPKVLGVKLGCFQHSAQRMIIRSVFVAAQESMDSPIADASLWLAKTGRYQL